jgi:leucyl aminopeptidase
MGLEDFRAEAGKLLLLHGGRKGSVRVLLAGLGRREDFTPKVLGMAMAAAAKRLSGHKLARPALRLESLRALRLAGRGMREHLLEEAVLGARLGLYAHTACKSAAEGEDAPFLPERMDLLYTRPPSAEEQRALRRALSLAEGICLARDLINGPANQVTPRYLEETAAALAGRHGFGFRSHDQEYLRANGLNAFLAVSLGAAAEPRLLVLEYAPPGTKGEDPVILLGKGITFDSGGISLKPAAGMERMKSDMAGAGAVLGLFAALGAGAKDFCRKRVIGLLPCTENMPGGRASRPGDVVKTLSGKTVEIVNTDAEGRLILCDCLTLAQNMARPAALIDIATLTGACVVGLGEKTAGLFSNDPRLRDKLLELAARNGERFWPMPIWDEDLKTLTEKSAADISNTGPREGGASFAALFLKQFVDKTTPWAHLDIAGPAFQSLETPTLPGGGAVGFGLRTLLDFVLE